VPWKFVEKLFLNKVLISCLILLGQGDKQYFFQEKCSDFFFTPVFLDKTWSLKNFATVKLPNNAWAQNNLENFWHNSEPIH